MNTHYAILIVRNERKAILGRLESGIATVGYLVLDVEMIFFAELMPVFLLALRENQDDAQLRVLFMKTLNGSHQDRLAGYRQELLRNLTSHAEALASGYYDYVIHDGIYN